MSQTSEIDELQDLFGLADQSGIGLLRFDAELSISRANDVAHAVLDRPSGRLLGRTPMEAFLDHRVEELVAAAASGGAGSHETGRDDEQRLLMRARPALGGGAWVSIETVTELRGLQRIRSEFADDLSHELRTPLANIRLLSEMLLSDLAEADVPDRTRERVATIEVESGHLAQLVDELLDLSRLEQGSGEFRHDEVALPALVDSVVARLRTFADGQGVIVQTQLAGGLPPIRGDEERLATLILNLLHNAIKFSPDGGLVTVAADEHPHSVVVSIADQGVGIPLAAQARVFERFYKVDRARHRGQGGTGLGLAIASHIAKAHGSQIWLESSEGNGSTFSFALPLT
ncbi:MAG: sensor histidine kinase [Chloroflexota bacterium]